MQEPDSQLRRNPAGTEESPRLDGLLADLLRDWDNSESEALVGAGDAPPTPELTNEPDFDDSVADGVAPTEPAEVFAFDLTTALAERFGPSQDQPVEVLLREILDNDSSSPPPISENGPIAAALFELDHASELPHPRTVPAESAPEILEWPETAAEAAYALSEPLPELLPEPVLESAPVSLDWPRDAGLDTSVEVGFDSSLPSTTELAQQVPDLQADIQAPIQQGLARFLQSIEDRSVPPPEATELFRSESLGQPLAASAVPVREGDRHIVFRLSGASYAVPIEQLLEADRLPRVTAVPGMPEFVRGIFNLRGEILPLVDLRLLLGMDPYERYNESRMLVVRTRKSGVSMAIAVDTLQGLGFIQTEGLSSAPSLVEDRLRPVLLGVREHQDGLVSVLDMDKLVALAESLEPIA